MIRVSLLCVVLTATVARAEHPGDLEAAKLHFQLGDLLYQHDRFEEAVREFEIANQLRPTPDFQYNIARCYEHMGRWREALEAYRRYVEATPTPLDADQMLAHMDDLKKQHGTELEAPPPTSATASAGTHDRAHAVGRKQRIAGIVLGGVGVALLGAGIGFAVLGNSTADSLTNLDRNRQAFDPALDSSLGTQRALAGAFLGIGATAVVAGAVVFTIGQVRARRARRAEVSALDVRVAF